MNGDHQLTREVAIEAPPEQVWAVVADSNRLAEWVPPVKEVSELSDGPEGVGTTRVCQVEFGGRSGRMTERCVAFVPPHRAAYVVDDDNLGFGRMFADYGFTVTIEDDLHGGSIARTETYYTPRNTLFKLINALFMRRRFESTVDDLLSGLKRSSERGLAPGRASSTRLSSPPSVSLIEPTARRDASCSPGSEGRTRHRDVDSSATSASRNTTAI